MSTIDLDAGNTHVLLNGKASCALVFQAEFALDIFKTASSGR